MSEHRRPRTLYERHQKRVAGYRRLANGGALLSSGAMSSAVFFLIRETLGPQGSLAGLVLPPVAALSLFTLLGISWHLVLSQTSDTDGARLPTLVGIAVVLTGFGIATSSWALATQFGGEMALTVAENKVIEAHENALRVVEEHAAAEDMLVSISAAAATEFGSSAEKELLEGIISGLAGDGLIFRMLFGSGNSLKALNEELQQAVSDRNALLRQAKEALTEARKFSTGGDRLGVAEALSDARSAIHSADLIRLGPLAIRAGSISVPSQATADDLRRTIARFVTEASRLEQRRPGVALPEAVRPISRSEAVIDYWEHVRAAWYMAVALDALPLMLVAGLLFASRGRALPRQRGWDDDEENLDSSDLYEDPIVIDQPTAAHQPLASRSPDNQPRLNGQQRPPMPPD